MLFLGTVKSTLHHYIEQILDKKQRIVERQISLKLKRK